MGATCSAGCAEEGASFEAVAVQGQRRRTLFIFDWDDTLMCTSAIDSQGCKAPHLQQLEQAAMAILAAALQHGDVRIVTNATLSWVHDSARRFFPRLVPMLRHLSLVSARDAHEASLPGMPIEWKRRSFQDVVAEWQRGLRGAACGTSLVVIGDSAPEMEAARSLRSVPCVKTLKLKEAPTVLDMVGELRRAAQELDRIVRAGDSASMSLAQPARLSRSTTRTCGWRISAGEAWGLPGHVQSALVGF